MIATEPTIEQMIAAVKAAGYKVTKPATRKLTPKKIIEAHLSGAHRGAFDEACRVCRFARAVKDHKAHEPITRKPRDVYDEVQLRLIGVNRCPLCVDAATEYAYPSMRLDVRPGKQAQWERVVLAAEKRRERRRNKGWAWVSSYSEDSDRKKALYDQSDALVNNLMNNRLRLIGAVAA